MLPFPVIDNDELAKIVHINADGDYPGYSTHVVKGIYEVAGGAEAMRARLEEIFQEVSDAIARGSRFVVLSDRDTRRDLAPIPSLLLTSAVHHHLIREKTRTKVGLLVEAGDVREVHHVALLVGFGAAAVNPYLAMESVEELVRSGALTGVSEQKAVANLIKALGKGVLKVMSKMGISTVASYCGAQVFEAVGLSQELVDRYFTGTVSQLGGVGLNVLAEEVAARHAVAYPPEGVHPAHRTLLGRWGVPVAARRRAAPVRPGHGVPAAALDTPAPLRHLQGVQPAGRRAVRAADDPARPVRLRRRDGDRQGTDPDRRGGAGQRDRQAVQHRCDELRLDQQGGARDPRRRDEPARRQVQHRGGR